MSTESMAAAAYENERARADRLAGELAEANRLKDSAELMARRLAQSVSMFLAIHQRERSEEGPERVERVRFLVDASIHDTSRALNQSWANVSDGARAMQANAARFLNGENIGDGPAGLLVTASLCAFAHKADSASYPADLLARFR